MKELTVIFTSAITPPCTARCNLSTTTDHLGTRNNLCSADSRTLEAKSSLSTTYDLQSDTRGKKKPKDKITCGT